MSRAIPLLSIHAFMAWTRKRKKIFKSVACLKVNKWNVTTSSTYSFSCTSSASSSPPPLSSAPPSPSPCLFLLLHLFSVLLYAAEDSSFVFGYGT